MFNNIFLFYLRAGDNYISVSRLSIVEISRVIMSDRGRAIDFVEIVRTIIVIPTSAYCSIYTSRIHKSVCRSFFKNLTGHSIVTLIAERVEKNIGYISLSKSGAAGS